MELASEPWESLFPLTSVTTAISSSRSCAHASLWLITVDAHDPNHASGFLFCHPDSKTIIAQLFADDIDHLFAEFIKFIIVTKDAAMG